MDIKIDVKNESRIAIISSNEVIIGNTQDALDLLATVQYYDCDKMIIHEDNIIDSFFQLRTGIAGEILQKYTNYRMKIAIVGVFDYDSKSLRDFIYECNKGRHIFFMKSLQDAMDKLHSV